MAAPFTTRLLPLLVTAVAAVAALSLGTQPAPTLRATAGGSLQLGSSRDGQAILTVSGLRPGGSADGTLVLDNLAPLPQRLTLSMNGLADRPGPGGGVLSQWLDLRVERGTEQVFAGKLGDLPELDLGDLAPGSSTPFRFTISLPEHGPATDDAYAGAGVDVSWSWRGDVDGAPPPPPPEEEKPPAETPPVQPPPAAKDHSRPVVPANEDRVERVPPSVDELEGPAATRAPRVRLWIGGRSTQRLGALGLAAVCRPECSLSATAKVRIGGRWRPLGAGSVRASASAAKPAAVRIRLSAAQRRALRAVLRGGAVARVTVTATAPGHAAATKTRTLRLRP